MKEEERHEAGVTNREEYDEGGAKARERERERE